jgi:hypothetical protein
VARSLNNVNTLQDADQINGGAGADTLVADMVVNSVAITPILTNIETVMIRAQSVPMDTTNGNNISSVGFTNTVQIDAQRSLAVDNFNNVTADYGVTKWESNNSRSDVIIEDVRIGNLQKTSDVTIAFVESDPGNVDYGVYFDQHSLRNTSSGNTTIVIKLMDSGTAAGYKGADTTKPLLNNPYDTFKFLINGVQYELKLNPAGSTTVASSADTYPQLLAAIQAGLAGTGVTAALGSTFTITDPLTNNPVTGTSIVLTGGAATITTNAQSGWYNTLQAPVPADANIYNKFENSATSTAELVTSKVILDDVGRGSTGGDLVVGGMSTGDTSTSRGVERFEIEVRDNSKLQTVNSTNNALREVTIVNGATSKTDSTDGAYSTTVTNQGNLTVNGDANALATKGGLQSTGNTQLPGVENSSPAGVHHGAGAAGFTDVRVINATTFAGKLEYTAAVTADSIAKYVTLVDTAADPVADVGSADGSNVNFDVMGANFIYTGGTNNDTISVSIDGGVAASRSTVVSGQSDFTFNVNGGTGDDNITVSVVDAANALTGTVALQQNWYNNQNLNDNIIIKGGEGNDIIRKPGAGDTNIDAGGGNDVVYTENTGRQALTVTTGAASTLATGNAAWVFNTSDQVSAVAIQNARDIFDMRSDTIETYNLYKYALTVSYRGLPSVAVTLADAATYKTTDYQINQAIKNAINTDPTLKFLLLAQDGPAGTLVVTSLTDGAQVAGDLSVAIAPIATLATTALSAAEVAGAAAAYGLVGAAATQANVLAAMAASYTTYVTNGDYVAALAQDQANANITGADSIRVSDNFVTMGAGNDLVVLGTAGGATLDTSSNEVVTVGAGFGNDVIVNFDTAGVWADHLNFSWISAAPTLGALSITNNLITVANVGAVALTEVALKTAVDALGASAAGAVATNQVYVEVGAHNVGTVFSIANGVAANDAIVTLQGTIDLADTAWATLTAAHYAKPSAIAEALSGAVVVVPPVVVGGTTLVPVTAAGTSSANVPAGNYTFNVGAIGTTYTYTISNFGAGDKLDVGTLNGGLLPSIVNDTDQTDGIQSFIANAPGGAVTITLTGLSAADDAAIFNVPSFNTVFGAGSLV